MQNVKEHFEQEAKVFDELILTLIPYYQEMLNVLILALPFSKKQSINIIDLGCGTGTVAKKIYEVFPKAKITCLDLAENMIEMAKIRLKDFSQTQYITAEFSKYKFKAKFDVIISSLALHHLITDNDKQKMYKKIFQHLNHGGVFYNADVVLGSNEYLQSIYMQKWKEYMQRNITLEEIDNKWMAKYKVEDHPSNLMAQIEWLKNIGFKDVDIIWKYYNFAVYGGRK